MFYLWHSGFIYQRTSLPPLSSGAVEKETEHVVIPQVLALLGWEFSARVERVSLSINAIFCKADSSLESPLDVPIRPYIQMVSIIFLPLFLSLSLSLYHSLFYQRQWQGSNLAKCKWSAVNIFDMSLRGAGVGRKATQVVRSAEPAFTNRRQSPSSLLPTGGQFGPR